MICPIHAEPVQENHYTYDPFGQAFASETDETIGNRFRFAGYKWDNTTGMYNCNARWYDPAISRFTGRDPVKGNYQEPLTLHAYLYCLNDPVNRTDPSGEFFAGVIGLTAGIYGQTLLRSMHATEISVAVPIALYALEAGCTLAVLLDVWVLADQVAMKYGSAFERHSKDTGDDFWHAVWGYDYD